MRVYIMEQYSGGNEQDEHMPIPILKFILINPISRALYHPTFPL